MKKRILCICALLLSLSGHEAALSDDNVVTPPLAVPSFRVDPFWPKALPNKWLVGAVAGVAVDREDHVWVIHRPGTLQPNETRAGWHAAPPVLEFDAAGNLLAAWGGPGEGYEWPDLEHGIYVDARDNIWIAGAGQKDAQVLKFTRDGKFLLQIGHSGKNRGSNDTENLGSPSNMVVDEAARELYVADGYGNHRVIVFDADTGGYKRHWGAYGRRPDDGYFETIGEKLPGPFKGVVQNENKPSQYDPDAPPIPQFRIVHAVRISNDGLVYVCDRTNDRIQVFKKDGSFVKEGIIARHTFGSGSSWDIAFSPDPAQRYLIMPDGTNERGWIVDRESLKIVGQFGGGGHWAGQFYGAHNIAADSAGDVFITESYEGKRVQKFSFGGFTEPAIAPEDP
jgi:DNA-binding beta-propeller fold protein YncE